MSRTAPEPERPVFIDMARGPYNAERQVLHGVNAVIPAGVRAASSASYVALAGTATGDGKAVDAKGLKWELLRVEQRWQWYSNGGNTNYEMQTFTRRVNSGAVDATGGNPAALNATGAITSAAGAGVNDVSGTSLGAMAGNITLDDSPKRFRSTAAARGAGIAWCYQHLAHARGRSAHPGQGMFTATRANYEYFHLNLL